ncbi:MAG: TIGR03905 family TSCPD domain-containing protein [Xylanivirga thermophila]|jgi:uncharacterized protein (TIGR03905 family)|uniref:TIGR03905 family TSCPD domain-containing protein n=1 Tax=Xylanivirga thermophila TaxID=2496273 RepID=UPI0039F538FE
MYQFSPKGVCSRDIKFDIVDGKITKVQFTGGCNGNLQGISKLVEGMEVEEAIKRLSGIRCGSKCTSCPDQFSKALLQFKGAGV